MNSTKGKTRKEWPLFSPGFRDELSRSWVKSNLNSAAEISGQSDFLSAWRGTHPYYLLPTTNEKRRKEVEALLWPGPRTRGPAPQPMSWPKSRTRSVAIGIGESTNQFNFPNRVWPKDRVSGRHIAMGYLPDVPDARDFGIKERKFSERIKALAARQKKSKNVIPAYLLDSTKTVDVSAFSLLPTGFFSPIEDQGPIGSCTAQATIGAIEYLMAASGAGRTDLSRLFLYKVTRRLSGLSGDTGAYIREAIKAIRIFGVPPEQEWPYIPDRIEDEPEGYHYSFASNFKAVVYTRLDSVGLEGTAVLDNVKRSLLDGFPVVFGFPVINQSQTCNRHIS